MELDKLIIKFLWNIYNNNQKKFWGENYEDIVILPGIKIYYKVLIINTVGTSPGIAKKDQWNKRKSSVIFKQVWKLGMILHKNNFQRDWELNVQSVYFLGYNLQELGFSLLEKEVINREG